MRKFLIHWEKIQRTMVLALRSLWLHKLRAFLSVLGIIIGTAAVISLMAFGEGSMRDALDAIKRQGATNIIVRSVKPPEEGGGSGRKNMTANYGITRADWEFLEKINYAEAIVPMRIFQQEIRRMQFMKIGRVVATTEDYQKVNKFELAMGRFLSGSDEVDEETEDDNIQMRNVAVIGSEIAEKLFPFQNPLSQTIVINRFHFVVVGVIKERMPTGAGGGSSSAEDFNSDVYIPMRTGRGRWGDRVYIRLSGSRSSEQVYLHQVTLKIDDMDHVKSTGNAIAYALKATHGYKQDWALTIPLDRLIEAEETRDRFTRLLVLIASISLVVGGIGIMNIMLATVTERTREIGIRRALGAKRADIILQFLIEATVQTMIGGLLGVLLGLSFVFAVPVAASWFGHNLPININYWSIVLSLVVSVVVGVAFGLYPAVRAAELDPIEALRHE